MKNRAKKKLMNTHMYIIIFVYISFLFLLKKVIQFWSISTYKKLTRITKQKLI